MDAAARIEPGRLRHGILAFLVGGALLAPATQSAPQLFRYENEDGVVVLSSTLPPRYASGGYTVLDHRGRVVKVVPRQLTEAERAERDKRREAERAAREAREERRRRDKELLRLYSTPDDVTRAMERQIASIEGAITTVESGIQRREAQKRNLERRAADLERAGRPIPERLTENIESLEAQIAELQEEVAQRRREIARTRESFAADRARLSYLLGLSDSPDGSGDA